MEQGDKDNAWGRDEHNFVFYICMGKLIWNFCGECDYMNSKVAFKIEENEIDYPVEPPFHPGIPYPEYNGSISEHDNRVYDMVRNLLHMLGYDNENYGTPCWNPLKKIICKGNVVLLKPNYVMHENRGGDSIWAVITHPSIIRAIIDYVYKALEGEGRVIIADAPEGECDFDKIVALSSLSAIAEYYRETYDFKIEVYDLRQMRFEYKNGVLLDNSRSKLGGDPIGYTIFDLGNFSEHMNIEHPERLYGADYDRTETLKHHSRGCHEYCISNTVLNADVIISLPKMKTHRKGGVTLNYKNFVGANGNKNYLPHFRLGDPKDGGDEYEPLDKKDKAINYTNRFLIEKLLIRPNKVKSLLYKLIFSLYSNSKKFVKNKRIKNSEIKAGAWYGNDTLWRTVLDINKIIVYGTTEGGITHTPQRRFFSIVDGIIAGEGNGPLIPKAKKCGILIAGEDMLLVDLVAIRLMDIDYRKIRIYDQLISKKEKGIMNRINSIEIVSNIYNDTFEWNERNYHYLDFAEPDGWEGKIKLH